MKKSALIFYLALAGIAFYMARLAFRVTPGSMVQDSVAPLNKIPVQRIVSLCKPLPIILLGLDAGDQRLVGVNPETKLAIESNVLNHYFPRIRQLPGTVCSPAFVPNIEELIKLKPDLILQWTRLPETIAKMQSFGFNVVGIDYDGTEKNDREIVQKLAIATDRKARSDSMMLNRDSVFQMIHGLTGKIPEEKKPRVIFVFDYENLRIGGEKCYENFCMELAGGRNMGRGLGLEHSVNIEQVLEWNPEIIFIRGWRTKITPDNFYQNPILAEVNAVKNRRVFKMPVWASNESELNWKFMAEIMHPELFAFSLREDIRNSYFWQYHIQINESDIDQVLFYKENASSPFFTRFKQQ